MTPPDRESLARTRFAILSAVRVLGVALMLGGIGVIGSGIVEPRDAIGGALFVIGAIDSMIVPRILARKWRTPPQA